MQQSTYILTLVFFFWSYEHAIKCVVCKRDIFEYKKKPETTSLMYPFWYSLLKYCCTHKYCKIWDNEHKRGLKHTKMVIVGLLMWWRRTLSLILTGVCVCVLPCGGWWYEHWRCVGRVGEDCVSVGVCVYWGFSKAPHSPSMFLSVHFTKTEEVVHDLTQLAPCTFVALENRDRWHQIQLWRVDVKPNAARTLCSMAPFTLICPVSDVRPCCSAVSCLDTFNSYWEQDEGINNGDLTQLFWVRLGLHQIQSINFDSD